MLARRPAAEQSLMDGRADPQVALHTRRRQRFGDRKKVRNEERFAQEEERDRRRHAVMIVSAISDFIASQRPAKASKTWSSSLTINSSELSQREVRVRLKLPKADHRPSGPSARRNLLCIGSASGWR